MKYLFIGLIAWFIIGFVSQYVSYRKKATERKRLEQYEIFKELLKRQAVVPVQQAYDSWHYFQQLSGLAQYQYGNPYAQQQYRYPSDIDPVKAQKQMYEMNEEYCRRTGVRPYKTAQEKVINPVLELPPSKEEEK